MKRSLYQCFNARVKGNRIYCSKGHRLGKAKDGHLPLVKLARGTPLEISTCQACTDYDEMGPPVPREEQGWNCPVPNPYWRYSELLTEQEVMKFLAGESSQEELKKVARYLLIFTENIAFAAHLYDKSEGHDNGREFNMPALEKLRGFYRTISNGRHRPPGARDGEHLPGDRGPVISMPVIKQRRGNLE